MTSRLTCMMVCFSIILGCNEDDTVSRDKYYYLDARVKENFPYSGEDTIHFLHIHRYDTQKLQFVAKDQDWGFTILEYEGENGLQREMAFERVYFEYLDDMAKETLEIRLSTREFDPSLYKTILLIIGDLSFELSYESLGQDSVPLDRDCEFLSEVHFNGKTYTNVIKVDRHFGPVSPRTTLYYNESIGFIRLEDHISGRVYQLM